MDHYILDTNLFFNLEAKIGLGNKTEEVMRNTTRALQKAAVTQSFGVMIPPRVVEEILSFFEDKQQQFLLEFLRAVVVKSPVYADQKISGDFIVSFIEESRLRAFRGMKIAEEELIHTAEQFMGKELLVKKELQIAIGKIVSSFRERYRNATRTGMIDSLADMDLVLLAREQDGALVSTDMGLVNWSRKMGVREVSPVVFGKMLQEYL